MSGQSLKISRILHAGYIFECGHTQIIFDPIFENPFSHNCYAFPSVRFDHEQIKKLKPAAVFISHFHDDHCSFESLNLLDRKTPIYLYCVYEELFFLLKELGFTQVHSLQIDTPVVVGTFEVIPRKALDADVDSIFQIKAAGLNVLNVVDSWIDPITLKRLSQNAPWDLVLWPFQTMREIEVLAPSRSLKAPDTLPPEWISQLRILNPRYVVPSSCQFVQESWSWYNHALFPISYRQFQHEIESALPATQVVRLNPSVAIVLDKNSLAMASPLTWVQAVGNQDVDYKYDPDLKPSTTAEIAARFPALSAAQTKKVFDYCHQGLLEKYKSMEPPTGVYFGKPRLWQLSVYDQTGAVTSFYYRIKAGVIERALKAEDSIAWCTEIPISKFYAALELGESLTSMYLRINDMVFASDIENEIQIADPMEDPLIRCLFTGVFGAYQKAQLKRLMNKEVL